MRPSFSLREALLATTVVALTVALVVQRFGPDRHAHRLPYSASKHMLRLRVLAADDFSPVPNVQVSLTWVGKGCDGGSHAQAVTDASGVAELPRGFAQGPIQVYLTPPKGGRFRETSFTKNQDMLTCRPYGTYYPSVFRLDVERSTDPDFQPH